MRIGFAFQLGNVMRPRRAFDVRIAFGSKIRDVERERCRYALRQKGKRRFFALIFRVVIEILAAQCGKNRGVAVEFAHGFFYLALIALHLQRRRAIRWRSAGIALRLHFSERELFFIQIIFFVEHINGVFKQLFERAVKIVFCLQRLDSQIASGFQQFALGFKDFDFPRQCRRRNDVGHQQNLQILPRILAFAVGKRAGSSNARAVRLRNSQFCRRFYRQNALAVRRLKRHRAARKRDVNAVVDVGFIKIQRGLLCQNRVFLHGQIV